MADVIRLAEHKGKRKFVHFDRSELDQLLSVYFRFVSKGDWRDYAIDHGTGMARFCVFRHANDRPLFTIAKLGDGSRKGRYVVYDNARKLKQSKDLKEVLGIFKIPLRAL